LMRPRLGGTRAELLKKYVAATARHVRRNAINGKVTTSMAGCAAVASVKPRRTARQGHSGHGCDGEAMAA
jgi:hypothetical protein